MNYLMRHIRHDRLAGRFGCLWQDRGMRGICSDILGVLWKDTSRAQGVVRRESLPLGSAKLIETDVGSTMTSRRKLRHPRSFRRGPDEQNRESLDMLHSDIEIGPV